MTAYSLTLKPYKKPEFTISLAPLYENDDQQSPMEFIIENIDSEHHVISEITYEFQLNCDSSAVIRSVDIFVNDILEPCRYSDGDILPEERWIFKNCYGYAVIGLTVFLDDGSTHHLQSKYLPVWVSKENRQLNDSIKAMIRYVYTHQESFLIQGERKSKDLSGLTEYGHRTLSAQLILAKELASIYESSYGYFKANSRFKIDKVSTVDYFEKLQEVSPATLQFIASHPEYLKRVNSPTGVRIRNQVYHPEKTLSMKKSYSYDIYENQVIIGFLYQMLNHISEMQDKCNSLLCQIPSKKEDFDDSVYIDSSFLIFEETWNSLQNTYDQLTQLYHRFTRLLDMYKGIFSIHVDPMNVKPQATPIFMSVPQYHNIFIRIHQWFTYGVYDYASENFMLSFTKLSSLYEIYLLAKMISYLTEHGYELSENETAPFSYEESKKMKYKNTSIRNIFVFNAPIGKLTLYFQPVIFKDSFKNGINLYRNNSIPVHFYSQNDYEKGANYYSPDYLIKYECSHSATYIIADAKFSEYGNLRRYQIKDLVFKYLFSISPKNPQDTVSGLCIIYGKHSSSEKNKDVYDWKCTNNEITPFFECIPLIEGIDDHSHDEKLDQLFAHLNSTYDWM